MRYFWGIFGFCAGMAIIVYRERLKRITGDMPFAERWFGPGGTYTAILILGILVSLGSIMYMFGTLGALSSKLFGPFFGTG